MRSRTVPRRSAARLGTALLALLLLACRADANRPAGLGAGPAPAPESGHVLTLLEPRAAQPLAATRGAAQPRFVEVEIARVVNPSRVPLSFAVHYLPRPGERQLLGTFSLFPPDRPGSFIVATGGRVQGGGSGELELELRALEPPLPGASVEVGVAQLRLR